ncbi:MAG: ABC transporter permease subunit [Alicyclobacillaceae bacterium]|nr:ABC transporter permease subunit [Alicyclobacillaceae bacterium]
MNRLSNALLAVLAAVPAVYIAAPLIHLLGTTRWTDVVRLPADANLRAAFATSAVAALWTTALSAVFGLPSAFALSRCRRLTRRLWNALLLLPVLLPPVVGGIAQLELYGPETALGEWFAARGWPLTGSLAGVVLAQTFVACPFLMLAAKAGFESVPEELIEATVLMGGQAWDVFWHVALPCARRAVLAGLGLTFARAVGEFGATAIVSYHPYTVPIALWVQFNLDGLDGIRPAASALVWLALAAALLAGTVRSRPR